MNTCSWCGRSTENVQLIEVRDEDSELPTGTAPVCDECLNALEGE
jgi:hypothetical protein